MSVVCYDAADHVRLLDDVYSIANASEINLSETVKLVGLWQLIGVNLVSYHTLTRLIR